MRVFFFFREGEVQLGRLRLPGTDGRMSTGIPGRMVEFLLGTRIFMTQMVAVVAAALLALATPVWEDGGFTAMLLEFAGLVLVVAGALGRLWASMYIAGYKGDKIITQGPYSMVRHPLYFFSLIGVTGIGLVAKSLVVLALLLVAFHLYYPFVVRREENDLSARHGEAYDRYARTVPRFFPRPSLFNEPETYPVNAGKYRRCFVDASFFILVVGVLRLLEGLHSSGVLPDLLRIP